MDERTAFTEQVDEHKRLHPGEALPYDLFAMGMRILERDMRGQTLDELCEED